jgi:PAS domain S-box-containing protein
MLDSKIIALSGFQEIKQVLESLHQEKNDKIILEPLFCRYGCINGPVANKEENIFSKREAVLEYARNKPGKEEETGITNSKLFQTFFPAKHHQEEVFSEEQITEILASTGKFLPEDELNCMACGYNSCREKAVAVLQGIAESSMCMPYMRRMAEKQFDTLIGHDPNGIVILDSNLNIAHMNNAFKKMFTCSDTIIGKRISYLIDPESFEKIATGNEKIIRDTIHYDNYNLVCFQISYSLPDQHQYIGIFVDITDIQSNREKLADIRSETMNKAQELLDHQINMAQELARFLGEHTAKEEILLKKLIDTTKK